MDEGQLSLLFRLRRLWKGARLWLIGLVGLLGTAAILTLPLSNQPSGVVLEVGDVSPITVQAPYELSYVSQVLTEQARQEAAAAVEDIYDPPSTEIARQQVEKLRTTLDYIDTVRADKYATLEQKLADLQALQDVELDEETLRTLLEMPDAHWEAVRLEAVSVLEQMMRREIRQDRLEEEKRAIPAIVSISLSETQAELVVKLVSAFVVPNAPFNKAATEAAREQARQAVVPVVKSYAEGETIIARGEVATPLHIEALQQYDLLTAPSPWRDAAVRLLLVVLLGGLFVLYAYRAGLQQLAEPGMALTVSASFLLSALFMQLMIPGRTLLPYVYPAATVPIVLTVLTNVGTGMISSVLLGALAGFLAPRGLELALYVTLSGIMGSLMIGQAERLSAFFWAGLASALASVAVVVIFRFPDPATDLLGKASLLGASLVCGLLSASLAFGLLLLIGSALGIPTSIQLIELSRPDHPLLQQLLRNAPGTYQHSLQVANLAEQAARAIGANALLTRVGALYHDIGKSLRPQFFIENQVRGQNVHEQLDPTTSASVILSHVRDGLELARKHRLPKQVQDFIPEHHGTLETSYQFREAVEAAGGDVSRVDRANFRYPGPRPRRKETAILMLADGVEAKARADAPASEEEIDRLVRWVIEQRLEEGQLDRVDLTLRDLDTIRRSFVNTLKGIYHPRITYPAQEEAAQEQARGEPEKEAPATPAEGQAAPPPPSTQEGTPAPAGDSH